MAGASSVGVIDLDLTVTVEKKRVVQHVLGEKAKNSQSLWLVVCAAEASSFLDQFNLAIF